MTAMAPVRSADQGNRWPSPATSGDGAAPLSIARLKIANGPPEDDANRTREPSALHTGDTLTPADVTRVSAPRSRSAIHTSDREPSSTTPAARRSSGDNATASSRATASGSG